MSLEKQNDILSRGIVQAVKLLDEVRFLLNQAKHDSDREFVEHLDFNVTFPLETKYYMALVGDAEDKRVDPEERLNQLLDEYFWENPEVLACFEEMKEKYA